jgi:hypothetical protein
MRNSLLGGLTAALAASGSAAASVWTVTGASIAGASQSVSSMRSGVIDISGGISGALSNEFLFGASPVVPFDSLAFFAFEDLGGTEYFGFYWVSLDSKSLQLTASLTGAGAVVTDTSLSSTGGSFTSSAFTSYYYLFSGVGVGSTIAMNGLVPNLEIQWLDWDGASWQLLGSGSRTGVSPGDESFSLGLASAVPGGGLIGTGGLLAGLVARRRARSRTR